MTVVRITRALLSLEDLVLDGDTYLVPPDGLDPGTVDPRRQLQTSPYVSGALDTGPSDVDELADLVLRVEVTAATHLLLQDALTELTTAVRQRSFELHADLDGALYGWSCMRGRRTVGFTGAFWFGRLVTPEFVMPRQPVPLYGPV